MSNSKPVSGIINDTNFYYFYAERKQEPVCKMWFLGVQAPLDPNHWRRSW